MIFNSYFSAEKLCSHLRCTLVQIEFILFRNYFFGRNTHKWWEIVKKCISRFFSFPVSGFSGFPESGFPVFSFRLPEFQVSGFIAHFDFSMIFQACFISLIVIWIQILSDKASKFHKIWAILFCPPLPSLIHPWAFPDIPCGLWQAKIFSPYIPIFCSEFNKYNKVLNKKSQNCQKTAIWSYSVL